MAGCLALLLISTLWLVVLGLHDRTPPPSSSLLVTCLHHSPLLGNTHMQPAKILCTSLVHNFTAHETRLCTVMQKTVHVSSPLVYTSVTRCRPQLNWSPHPIWPCPFGQKPLCTQRRDLWPVSSPRPLHILLKSIKHTVPCLVLSGTPPYTAWPRLVVPQHVHLPDHTQPTNKSLYLCHIALCYPIAYRKHGDRLAPNGTETRHGAHASMYTLLWYKNIPNKGTAVYTSVQRTTLSLYPETHECNLCICLVSVHH